MLITREILKIIIQRRKKFLIVYILLEIIHNIKNYNKIKIFLIKIEFESIKRSY